MDKPEVINSDSLRHVSGYRVLERPRIERDALFQGLKVRDYGIILSGCLIEVHQNRDVLPRDEGRRRCAVRRRKAARSSALEHRLRKRVDAPASRQDHECHPENLSHKAHNQILLPWTQLLLKAN